MKKLFSIGVLMLVVLVGGIVMTGCGNRNGNGNGIIPDPGGDFEYGRVFVRLTEDATVEGKVWTVAMFPGFTFSNVENVAITENSQVLIFHFTSSRDNVLRAIYYLRSRDEVKLADFVGTESR